VDNFSIFMHAAAKFMVADRPDVFSSEDEARKILVDWYTDLAEDEDSNVSWSTAGFNLRKTTIDGFIHWHLERQIVSFAVFPDEEVSHIYNEARSGEIVGKVNMEIPTEADRLLNDFDDSIERPDDYEHFDE